MDTITAAAGLVMPVTDGTCPQRDWEVIYDDGKTVSERCTTCGIVHRYNK
jgi:hypothetical protein